MKEDRVSLEQYLVTNFCLELKFKNLNVFIEENCTNLSTTSCKAQGKAAFPVHELPPDLQPCRNSENT